MWLPRPYSTGPRTLLALLGTSAAGSRGVRAGCRPRCRELSPAHGWVAAHLYGVWIFLAFKTDRYSTLSKNLRMPENFITCIKHAGANRASTTLFDLQTEGATFILDGNTSALDGFGPGHFAPAGTHQVQQLLDARASCSTQNVGIINYTALPPATASTPLGTTKCCH